jgi:hypothetical protein
MKQILNEWRKFINESEDDQEVIILDSPEANDPWKYKKENDKWWAQQNGRGQWHDITSAKYLSTLEKLNAKYPELSVDIDDIEQPAQTTTTSQSGTSGTAGSIVHEWDVGETPILIYVYPGVGYGTQSFVNNKIVGIQHPENIILLIAKNHNTPWSSFKGDGVAALNGKEVSSTRIVGWSGGSAGLADALSSDSFNRVIYADPSPRWLLDTNHGNAVMYYNPSNWSGNLSSLGDIQQEQLAPQMESSAKLVDKNHNEILEFSLREIIK